MTIDPAKRLIELCETFSVSAVRSLLAKADSSLILKPDWRRIVNFSVSNGLCDFDSNLKPIKLQAEPPNLPVAELIRNYILENVPANGVMTITDDQKSRLNDVLNTAEPQPFAISGNKITIKDSWLYLFDEKEPKSIRRWLNNFFNISYRFLNPNIIEQTIVDGSPQWAEVFGPSVRALFDLKSFDPKLFLSIMTAMHQSNTQEAESILASLENIPATVLDIGGATGAFARFFAKAKPGSSVSVYEKDDTLPLIEEISKNLNLVLPENVNYISGDFFRGDVNLGLFGLSPSRKFDLIILGWILHDWQDDDAMNILKRASLHLNSNGKILLIEKPLNTDGTGVATKLDLTMMLQTGGRERSLEQYSQLAERCGFRLYKYTPSNLRRDYIFLEAK